MEVTTKKWDASEHLDSPEIIIEYLKAALEEEDTEVLMVAIGNIAKAKGMSEIAKKTKLNRQSLYKTLSPKGSPKFETVLKVLRALNLKLTIEPAGQ